MSQAQETKWETVLPKHTYAALRVDGKNFSRYTKSMRQDFPFNDAFTDRMISVALLLAEEVEGSIFAFVGSDEVSVIFQDLGEKTEKWFGGRIQKIASVAASVATAAFNKNTEDLTFFDARVFDLGPSYENVLSYLNERRRSVQINSISMYASHFYSHKILQNMSTKARLSLLEEDNRPWQNLPARDKEGLLIYKIEIEKPVQFVYQGETKTAIALRKEWKTGAPGLLDDSSFSTIH
jgi:tRNA(His) guanylyltransferase